jgi:pimeloyl-ACP methyl ester carboxylesterase
LIIDHLFIKLSPWEYVLKIKKKLTQISILTIITLMSVTASRSFPSLASGQTSPCDNVTITGSSNKAIPVILIHGYGEDSGIWSQWERLLEHDGIPFCTVSFHQSDDRCGSAVDHAKELAQVVQQIKIMTGQNQVNMVGHSKGGLDARVYLANSRITDVANLIMMGTPNAGGPLASQRDPCYPAVLDFIDHAPATRAPKNPHTNYYTIAGDWSPPPPPPFEFPQPIMANCPPSFLLFIEEGGFYELQKHNDGIVPASSVESIPNSTSLGHTPDCHTNLFSSKEYALAKPVLEKR